jgi:hypothetical protein
MKLMVAKRSYSMRPDGKLVVDVPVLLASRRVQADLDTLRRKIAEADERRARDRHPGDSEPAGA